MKECRRLHKWNRRPTPPGRGGLPKWSCRVSDRSSAGSFAGNAAAETVSALAASIVATDDGLIMQRLRGARWIAAGAALLGAVVIAGCATGPLLMPPLSRNEQPLLLDGQVELARRYAPWILNEVATDGGRQDLPTRADFDGNLRGDDNWENLARFELPPVVYYAVVESTTHWFITWHLFHPRDWSRIDLGLNMTHENDGENLQVVVAKANGRVVLLFTQAHYRGGVYANRDSGFAAGSEEIRGPLDLVDDAGRPATDGTHAVVFVERCGHGIYGLTDRRDEVELGADGAVRFSGRGFVLRPAAAGEEMTEPRLDSLDVWVDATAMPYALASSIATFWPGLDRGCLVGEGGLFDGALRLVTPEVTIDVPRYYEADRFSGPLGSDRGISPFAVDFGFGEGEVGALFFDPARRYARCLTVPRSWSINYVAYPFVRSEGR